jgi:hypothetical protein
MSGYTCEYTTPDKTSIIFTHSTQPQFKINVGEEYDFTYRRGGGDTHIKVIKIDPKSDNPNKPGVIYYKALASRGIAAPFVSGPPVQSFENPVFSETERIINVSNILGLKDGKINVIGGGGVSNRSKRSKKTKSKRGGRRSRCRSIKKYRKVRKSRRRRYMSS